MQAATDGTASTRRHCTQAWLCMTTTLTNVLDNSVRNVSAHQVHSRAIYYRLQSAMLQLRTPGLSSHTRVMLVWLGTDVPSLSGEWSHTCNVSAAGDWRSLIVRGSLVAIGSLVTMIVMSQINNIWFYIIKRLPYLKRNAHSHEEMNSVVTQNRNIVFICKIRMHV